MIKQQRTVGQAKENKEVVRRVITEVGGPTSKGGGWNVEGKKSKAKTRKRVNAQERVG